MDGCQYMLRIGLWVYVSAQNNCSGAVWCNCCKERNSCRAATMLLLLLCLALQSVCVLQPFIQPSQQRGAQQAVMGQHAGAQLRPWPTQHPRRQRRRRRHAVTFRQPWACQRRRRYDGSRSSRQVQQLAQQHQQQPASIRAAAANQCCYCPDGGVTQCCSACCITSCNSACRQYNAGGSGRECLRDGRAGATGCKQQGGCLGAR